MISIDGAMSFSLTPRRSAKMRSTSTLIVGSSPGCWMRASATPGTWATLFQHFVGERAIGLALMLADDLDVDRRAADRN